jgi:hypothetical protein
MLLKSGMLEKFVGYAANEPGAAAVLVLFDADNEPACMEGPAALERVRDQVAVPVSICVAVRNIENWILASAETTLGIEPLSDPEGRGAIQAVKTALAPRAYNKPVQQPGLTEKIEFDRARSRCPSFDRFLRKIDEAAAAAAESRF